MVPSFIFWQAFEREGDGNRLFPSSKKSHFQSEVKWEAIDMKMIFNCHGNKTHFHNKGFALSLVLKVRFFGTRKWPIRTRDHGSRDQIPPFNACHAD